MSDPGPSAAAQRLDDDDLEGDGYVMNLTRVWAHQPEVHERLAEEVGAPAAAGVRAGDDTGLHAPDAALARWASWHRPRPVPR